MATGPADQGQRPLDLGSYAVAAGGIYPQASSPTTPPAADTTAAITRQSDKQMLFADVVQTVPVTLTQLLNGDSETIALLFEINENVKAIRFLLDAALG